MKNVLQWEIPKWFTRIISIILLWYMIPLCTGIVEGFIRNDMDGNALIIGVILFPFLGIINFITTIAAFCHFLGFQNSTLGSLTAILLLIAAVPLTSVDGAHGASGNVGQSDVASLVPLVGPVIGSNAGVHAAEDDVGPVTIGNGDFVNAISVGIGHIDPSVGATYVEVSSKASVCLSPVGVGLQVQNGGVRSHGANGQHSQDQCQNEQDAHSACECGLHCFFLLVFLVFTGYSHDNYN